MGNYGIGIRGSNISFVSIIGRFRIKYSREYRKYLNKHWKSLKSAHFDCLRLFQLERMVGYRRKKNMADILEV